MDFPFAGGINMTIFSENIKKEHLRAEVERLDEGWSGCGCADCQELYREIDLKKYGSRVREIDGEITISDAPWMQPKDYWIGDDVLVHYGKKYVVNELLQNVCLGPVVIADAGEVALLKIVNPAESCPAWEDCKAPLCPLDDQSMKFGVWYPDEQVCWRRGGRKVPWVKIQHKVQIRAKRQDFYFTVNDFLTMSRVVHPLGHDPDALVRAPAGKRQQNMANNVPSEKARGDNRKKESGEQGSFTI
jgi:hypothetical protein